MKIFYFLATLLTIEAQYRAEAYGFESEDSEENIPRSLNHFDQPIFHYGKSSQNEEDSQVSRENNKIHKFISIHIAPPDESPREKPKPIRFHQKPDKHYQIVFIKAPSSPSEQQEIQLPPPPELKTLVYVLLKKQNLSEMLKIKGHSTPKPPSPPDVFFIRYKGQAQGKKGTPPPPPPSYTQNIEEPEDVENVGANAEYSL